MAPCGSRMAPRGPKSSRFLGVKKRGEFSYSVDMRCGRRWEVSGFPTEELAGVAHDFFRLFHGVPQYISRKAENLNFPDNRELLVQFSEQHGMERFKVVPMEEEKSWAVDKKKEFMDLMEEAHNQIKSAEVASAEESTEAAEVAEAADIVQGSNDDLSHIRPNGEENMYWDIPRAFQSCEGSHKWFYSRESESAINPRIVELEALLSAETEKNAVLEMLCAGLQAQNGRLMQQLAGLPPRYEHSRGSLAAISPWGAEPKTKADSSDTLLSPLNHICTYSGEVKDATTCLPDVYEPEAEISKGVQQNCPLGSLSEVNPRLEVENQAITSVYENWGFGAVGEQIEITSGVDWYSNMNGTGIINTSGCGSWGCDIVENQSATGSAGLDWNIGLMHMGTINMSVYGSEVFGVMDNQIAGSVGSEAITSSEWNMDGQL